MQKHNCKTIEELEVRYQELHRQFLVTQDMVDNAISRNDLERASEVGAYMDEIKAKVHEIEEAINTK